MERDYVPPHKDFLTSALVEVYSLLKTHQPASYLLHQDYSNYPGPIGYAINGVWYDFDSDNEFMVFLLHVLLSAPGNVSDRLIANLIADRMAGDPDYL